MPKDIKALSLFANVGIAETYLDEIGIKVVLANELEPDRASFYQHLYPQSEMIVGDITDKKKKELVISKAKEKKVDLIIATPPCQGMSTAGKKDVLDPRNALICDALEVIKNIKPSFIMLENVPEQLKTWLLIDEKEVLIPDYICNELGQDYYIDYEVVNAADYGVPQTRERAIFLMTRKDHEVKWHFPNKEENQLTMRDAIGDLPILDPLIKDVPFEKQLEIFPEYEKRKAEAAAISKWHTPPVHVYRQVYAMMHTPTGKSAFENIDEFKPKKQDGNIVRGYKNTYKRQEWDKPAFTVTMYNRTIGSQNNVHPGRMIGRDEDGFELYSDPRVLTIFELMRIMSLPDNWDIPIGYSDNFIRSVIGEGIPPLLVKKIMEALPNEI